MERTLFIILVILILGLLLISFLLLKNLRKSKELNKRLSDFNQLRKTFIDADRSLIQLKDEDLKYIFVNKAFEELYHKDASEIIGKDDFELIDVEYAYNGKRTDLAALEQMDVVVDQIIWGEKIFSTTKFPVKLPNDQYGVGAYIEDVTEEYNNKNRLLKILDELKQNQNELQLVLDSVAEGIYGVDKNGICTFSNKSSLEILGYSSEEQLLGKNIHWTIHHSREDGTPISLEECKILSTFETGRGVHVEDEVFWRADGTSFDVEYFSYPEYTNGEISRVLVTFLDITDRKEAERNILYNSYHDSLTGLYNRRFLEDELDRIDMDDHLPISVIVGDVNGLKQTNDIFGHTSGDMLIQQAAEIIKKHSRASDISIRTGGDEFLIILPNTSLEEAAEVAERIREQFSKVRIQGFHGSISLGISSKIAKGENIIHTIDKADSNMYAQKSMDRLKFNKRAVAAIMKRLHEICPWEKEHSKKVRQLCLKIGSAMNLSSSELRRLMNAAYYHDIGKVILEPELLNKSGILTKQEMQLMRRHPVVGYRILNLSDKTLDIAKYVLSHHERWDGNGYPNQLKEKAIPKISRILTLADAYESMISGSNDRKALSKEEAIQEVQMNAGTQFDPAIVDVLIAIING